MSIFGKLLGAGLSIFGANKARKQARQDALNKFVDLRAAADAGGINVLTALGATGGQGFGAYGSSAPPLASVELLTGALGDYEDERNGTADLRRSTDRLNNDLAKIKLEQARSGVYAPPPPKAYAAAGGTVFAESTVSPYPARHVKTSGGANNGPFPLALGSVAVPDPTLDRGTGVFVNNTYVAGAPGWSSAQVIEDNYGELGGTFYGVAKAAADFSHNRKEYLKHHTVGTPLRPPPGYRSRIGEIMPPRGDTLPPSKNPWKIEWPGGSPTFSRF